MRKPKKGKYPKKASLRKYKVKPKLPKGGIKTETQLKNYEGKKGAWLKHKKEIDGINKKISGDYQKECKKIDAVYKSGMKRFDDFRKKVDKAKTI